MTQDIEKYKPNNVKKSDKYSASLYKFLKKHKDCGIKAYAPQWWMLDGSFKPFDFDDPKSGEIYIGFRDDLGWLVGNRLATILLGESEQLKLYSYAPGDGSFYKNMIDITDWFYPAYEKEGRALWDRAGTMHMMGDEDRWTYVGNTRRCSWSGRWYRKEITKSQTTTRKEMWVAA